MEPVLYIDVLFFINGLCSSFTLWIAGKLFAVAPKWWRVFLGGFLSSLCWCCFLVFGKSNMVVSIVLMMVGIWIAYTPRTIRRFFGLFVALWIASFLWGGFLTVLDCQIYAWFLGGQWVVKHRMTSGQILLWGTVLFYMILRFGQRYLARFGTKRTLYCQLIIERAGKTCHLDGFFDTGNGLETKVGKPVIVAEFSACMGLFSKDCALQLLKKEIPTEGFEKIMYSALGTQNGELSVFFADRVVVIQQKKQVVQNHVAVGLYFDAFSGNYTALVPPIFIEEEVK